MNSRSNPENKGRRSGADRRTKIITPYMDFVYSGDEKRSKKDRRKDQDRRSTNRSKKDK